MKKLLLLSMMLAITSLAVKIIFPLVSVAAEPTYNNNMENELDALIETAMREAREVETEQAMFSLKAKSKSKIIAPAPQEKTPEILKDFELKQANIEDVVRIISEAEGSNIMLDPALKGKKIDLYLKNVSTDEVLQLLCKAYGLGTCKVGNSLFIAAEQKIKDGTTMTKVIELKNISAKEAKTVVDRVVTVVNQGEETNNIVLLGPPQDIKRAEEILKNIDLPQAQVVLEAKIIEVDNDGLKKLGIDWSDSSTVNFQETVRKATLDEPAVSYGTSPLRIFRLTSNAIQFNAVIHMLQQINKARVLSSPKVTTVNNKEAEIFIGDRIPYTVNTIAGGAVSTDVRFVEPGIRLKITPSLIGDDFVAIKVVPEVSYVYTFRGGDSGAEYPWVKTRQATAYVRVKNQQPFVLGGLLSKEDKKNLYKTPFLSSIPFLGALFKYESTTTTDNNLIIIITPTVLTDSREGAYDVL